MKILYLHQYFNTPEMSGGTRSYEMARRFVDAGHEVHIITSWREDYPNSDWFENEFSGIHIHWLPVKYSNNMSFFDRTLSFFKFAFKAAFKASSIDSDVVFATSTPLTIALPAVYSSKMQNIPMVFEVRDLWPELPIAMGALTNPVSRYLAKKLEKFAYFNSDSIIALSPGMKKGIVSTGYPSYKIGVVPNSSDNTFFDVNSTFGLDFRAKRKWLGDRPLLLYTGTFGLINGVSYLVDLALELSKLNSNVQILVIGGGIEFQKVYDKAKSVGVLNKNFYIESYLKKKDIPSALSAATACSALFIDKPEMRPNSANKFFDTLAAGKPILINYGGWMHDIVSESECGLCMWRKDLNDVASEVNIKLNDTQWLKNASIAAKDLAINTFDRDVLATQLLTILTETVAGSTDNVEKIAPSVFGIKK